MDLLLTKLYTIMRNSTFLKSFLLLCALIVGAGTSWAADPEFTLDFTSAWTAAEDNSDGEKVFTKGDYTISGKGSANFKFNSGYFIFGKNGAYIKLPKVNFDVEKIEVVGNSTASASVIHNIFVGDAAVSTAVTGLQGTTSTFNINSSYQAANTQYILKITSNHNAQITHVKYYKKVSSGEPETVVMPTEGVEDWNVTSGQYQLGGSWTDVPTTEPAKVAFDGDDVYIQMTVSEITLTIKGVKSGNTVTFPKNQTVPYLMTLYLMGTSDGTTASDIVFSYDSGTKKLTQTTQIVASMAADGVASAMAAIKDIVLQKAASASTTIYSWNGNGSTTTANETGGTALAKGENSNIAVGVSQKGNYCFKLNKGFSNAYYVEITLDQTLAGGETITIGAFRTSETSATLGVDFGTTSTQSLNNNTDVLTNNGTPTDWEFTVPAAAAGSNKIRLYRNSGSTGMWVSKVVVTAESSGSGTDATWSLNPTSATVYTGESTTLQLTTDYDGELTFTSNDESIATVSYDSSSKVITVSGVAVGETTVSVTGAATATYNAINKIFAVTVNHAELESNFIDVMGPLGYSYFGLKPEGENTYAQPDVTSTDKTDSYGLKISIAKAEGATLPRFDSDYTRFYKNNTLTVTAPTGSYITKIVFVEPASGAQWKGTMTVVEGEYVNSEKTWYATSTGVTSVVFTGKDDTNRIGSVKVYLMATSIQATVTAAGWATWVAPVDVTVPSGVEAYAVALNGNKTSLTALTDIPAGTPVLLKNEDTFQFPLATTTPAAVTTALKVSDGTGVANAYVLAKPAGHEIGFYKWTDAQALPAGKVYLVYPGTSAPDFISLDGDATDISEKVTVISEQFATDPVYNLNGQRVAQPTKGLYIVNGKKVIIK